MLNILLLLYTVYMKFQYHLLNVKHKVTMLLTLTTKSKSLKTSTLSFQLHLTYLTNKSQPKTQMRDKTRLWRFYVKPLESIIQGFPPQCAAVDLQRYALLSHLWNPYCHPFGNCRMRMVRRGENNTTAKQEYNSTNQEVDYARVCLWFWLFGERGSTHMTEKQ